MLKVTLPRLVGTREAARALVDTAATSDDQLHEARIYARAAVSVAPSFVDALVAALQDRGVTEIIVVGGSVDLMNKLDTVTRRRHGVTVRRASSARPVPA